MLSNVGNCCAVRCAQCAVRCALCAVRCALSLSLSLYSDGPSCRHFGCPVALEPPVVRVPVYLARHTRVLVRSLCDGSVRHLTDLGPAPASTPIRRWTMVQRFPKVILLTGGFPRVPHPRPRHLKGPWISLRPADWSKGFRATLYVTLYYNAVLQCCMIMLCAV